MSETTNTPQTTLLIILDGWGHSDSLESNAIAAANTPTWDQIWANAPHTLISGSGEAVGLPDGQMGNSEVGHMNLGAGRVVDQDLTRIAKSIEDGAFLDNPILIQALDSAKSKQTTVHVLGLLSPGGVHSHQEHIQALIKMSAARGNKKLQLHAFLDGRDMPPRSAGDSIKAVEQTLNAAGYPGICSVVGRYYAMDRDNRWDRVQLAYDLLTSGKANYSAESAIQALENAYARDENDEFVKPSAIHLPGVLPAHIEDGDVVIFMNFRADRARQITRAFTNPGFDAFERLKTPKIHSFVTLTQYADDIEAQCAFGARQVKNSFGEYLSELGHKQLRIAETEKYAHVTFFFSGGRETPFTGETRCLIPSPKVATYDLQPEMSAAEVTDNLLKAIASQEYAAIICNFANGDMVGHTGIFDAAIIAVETLDHCLQRIIAAIKESGSQCLITADHGNVERMRNASTGQAHTAHTSEPVPLVYIGPAQIEKNLILQSGGSLSDVAPTLLSLMGLKIPPEMTGRNLTLNNNS